MTIGILITLTAFLAAFLGIFTVNLIFVDIFQRDREAVLERLNEELMEQHRQRARETTKSRGSGLDEVLEQAARESQERKGIIQRIEEMLVQSGLSTMTMGRLLSMAGGVGLAVTILTAAIFGSFAYGGAAGGVAAMIPFLYVSFARQRRLDAIRSQLPDALELMSRVLRAGQSITQGIKAVSEEFKPPVSMEFGYCYEQQNLGLAPEIALHELAQRTGLLEMKIFVLAVLVHRQAGGNLTELLDNISNVVRQRFKLRTEIKTLTAEGRLQAVILMALPFVVWGMLLVVNRPYALQLFEHPSLLMGTAGVMVLGAVWIRRIVNFEF